MTDKAALRTLIAGQRRARSEAERDAARLLIRSHVLQWCQSNGLSPGSRIAAYEPLRTEPGSVQLLDDLVQAGFEVVVPITLPDNDLDWKIWSDNRQEHAPLGRDAIGQAALVLAPAFAVDAAGRRLGRGGGSYDRALMRVPPGTPVIALLFEDEMVAEVPVADWDVEVSAVISPDGWHPCGAEAR
jgi:5-formyltetrahydrofolate cyclo-ligase